MAYRVRLGMYDLPPMRPFIDQLWASISEHLRQMGMGQGLPKSLDRSELDLEQAFDKDLLLGQTCGYPYIKHLKDLTRLVATPCYQSRFCDGPYYRNLVLVRDDSPWTCLEDARGGRFVYNETGSQSGYNSIRGMVAALDNPHGFFSSSHASGQHIKSVCALAAGEADLCSVDCVTFSLLEKHQPGAIQRVRVLEEGPLCPGLPLVMSHHLDDSLGDVLLQALKKTTQDQKNIKMCNELLLGDFATLTVADYKIIANIERFSAEKGVVDL